MTITLTAGVLPQPACYATEQARFAAYVAAIIASVTGGAEWESGTTAPTDLTKYWLRIDANGRPMEILKYNPTDSAWERIFGITLTGSSAGVANAYTLTHSPPFPNAAVAYRFSSTYVFGAAATNTGPSTLNIDGLGAKTIKKFFNQDLTAGDIQASQIVMVMYDGTNFQMVSPASGLGVAQLQPGSNLDFLRTWLDGGVPKTRWEGPYTTAAADYLTIPAAGSAVTFNHNLGSTPTFFKAGIICTDAAGDAGYAQNDFIPVGSVLRSDLSESLTTVTEYANSTLIGFVRNSIITLAVNHKTTGVLTPITEARWRVMAKAIR